MGQASLQTEKTVFVDDGRVIGVPGEKSALIFADEEDPGGAVRLPRARSS